MSEVLLLPELDRRSISQNFCYPGGKLGGIIPDRNYCLGANLRGVFDHSVKGLLTSFLTDGGVGFDIAPHDLLETAHQTLGNVGGTNDNPSYNAQIAVNRSA